MVAPICSNDWCAFGRRLSLIGDPVVKAVWDNAVYYVGDELSDGVVWRVYQCSNCKRQYRTLAT